MNIRLLVCESYAGKMHLLIEGELAMACGAKGADWQIVAGRRLRGAAFCRHCLRAVQWRVKVGRGKMRASD